MCYKFVPRYYLVKNKQDIIPETPCFDWVGETNIFESFRFELNLNWRVVKSNGKYGIVDMLAGEIVLDCIYDFVSVSFSKRFGVYLHLNRKDSNSGTKFCGIYIPAKRKILFELECEEITEAQMCENHFFVRRQNMWGMYNIVTHEFTKECNFSLKELSATCYSNCAP